MARRGGANNGLLKPVTIRVSPEDYALLKEYADARQVSLNTVVTEAIAQYGAKIQRRRAIERMEDLQRRIRETNGVGTDSVELLRELREERAEHLASGDAVTAEKSRGERGLERLR